LSLVLGLVPVLINVAFVTLLERKILGLSQSRKGPNKVSYGGVLQPFADAVKLFAKQNFSPRKSNYYVFFSGPVVRLTLMLMAWGFFY